MGLWRRGPRQVVPGLVLAVGVSLCLGLPVLRAAWWTLQADPLVFRPPAHALADIEPQLRHNAVDPRTFLWPGSFQSVSLPGESFRHSSYLGWLALGLALRSRAWLPLLVAATGLLLSLGPWLWFDGDWVTWQGQRLALPYKALFELLPASIAGHPQRVGLPAIALLAGLAARGLTGLAPRPAAGLAALALAEVLLLSPSPWPLARTAVVDPAPAAVIRELAGAGGDDPGSSQGSFRGIVLDLPADVPGRGMLASRHLFLQSLHGLPLPYKPDVRANTTPLAGLASFQWLTSRAGDPPLNGGWELHRAGVRVVVVHRDLLPPEEAARLEEALAHWYSPPREVSGTAIFAMRDRSVPATPLRPGELRAPP